MPQILDWLKELDLEQYGDRFVANGIDASVLRDLNDQDLEQLGVLLGHRRKILRAIAENAEQSKNAAPFAESESKAPTHTFNPPKSYTQDPLSAASNDSSGSARRRAEASHCAVLRHRQLDGLGGAALVGLALLCVSLGEYDPALYRGGFALVGVLSVVAIAATNGPAVVESR